MSGGRFSAFAVVGESVIDLFDPGDGSAAVARPGGSPLNVAVGLARLGNPTEFVGRLSRDPLGTLVHRHLERSGVGTAYVVRAAEPSTMALVALSNGQATYEFSAQGTADFQWSAHEVALPADAAAVHFGSLASWLPPGDEVLNAHIAGIRAAGSALISYDPNTRPGLQTDPARTRALVQRSAALAHVIKASSEDVAWLYGADSPTAVAEGWLSQGAELVVITAGASGATAWVAGLPPLTRPAFPAQLADTVGAGDAFMSGLLDSLARRGLATPGALAALSDPTALAGIIDDAALVSAITCGRVGANPPTRSEVDDFRSSHGGQ